MLRRQVLGFAPAALLGLAAGKPRILYFTRSAGFEHSVVKRSGSGLSHSENVMMEIGRRDGFDIECSKDGRIFDGDLSQYAAFAFYTTGDLTKPAKDGSPPMSAAGKRRLLEAVASGAGFIGFHSATDTFHSSGPRNENQAEPDPYIAMVGGEFVSHGAQQEASLHAVSPFLSKNAGVPAEGLSFTDEWYTGKNFAPDLHVILVQETKFMQGDAYRRPDFPQTWARMHGKGRVFYTSLGHREDVWTNPFFQAVAQTGMAWTTGRFDFVIKPNLGAVTPGANVLKS
ncbi:MAG: ThuA domain-containing protein [Bryobacteraceae bacterium]